jgi:hypothetical protein
MGTTERSFCSLKFEESDFKYPVENQHFLIEKLDSGVLQVTNKRDNSKEFYPKSYHQLKKSLAEIGGAKFTQLVKELGSEFRSTVPDSSQRALSMDIYLRDRYPQGSEKGKFIRNVLEPILEKDYSLYQYFDAPRVDDTENIINTNIMKIYDRHHSTTAMEIPPTISELSFSNDGTQLYLSRPTLISDSSTTYFATDAPQGESRPAFLLEKPPSFNALVYDPSNPDKKVNKPWFLYRMPENGNKKVKIQSKKIPYYDPQSKKLFYINDNNTLYSIDKKGVQQKIADLDNPDKMLSSRFLIKDNKAVFVHHDTMTAFDISDRSIHHISINYRPLAHEDFLLSDKFVFNSAKKVRPDQSPILNNLINFNNCERLLPLNTILSCMENSSHLPEIRMVDINNIAQSMLCQTNSVDKNFNAEEFKDMPFIKGELSDELNATLFLLAMQKPGIAELVRDPVLKLSKLYYKGFHKKHPSLFRQAITAIASSDDTIFHQTTEAFPNIAQELKCQLQNDSPLYQCATKEEYAKLQNSLFQTMAKEEDPENAYEYDTPMMLIYNMELLPCISPALHSMPPDKRDKLHDQYASAMADRMKNLLNGTFRSTLYYRAHHAFAPYFDVKRKKGHPESELVIDRDGVITPFIISSSPIVLNQSTTSDRPILSLGGALFLQQLPSPTKQKTKAVTEHSFSWSANGKQRNSTVRFTPVNGLQYVDTKSDSPRYEDIWKDNTLYGLHITNEHDENIYDGLISHYARKGYRIHPSHYKSNRFKPLQLDSYKKYLKDSIVQCKTDLLHKIAHSGGDALNLMTIPRQANVVRLYNSRPDGRAELVDVLYPGGESSKKDFITNREFGEWIRERDKKCNNQQLIYVNGSCNSADQKASNEILAARSPNFVDISSNTLNYLYPTYEKAGSLLVFDGMADQKSYSEIKKDINKVRPEGYEDFLFPNSSEYEEIIISPIMESYDYEFLHTN